MSDPSALPIRPVGTRSRAGNAMARTRAAVVDGALRCIEKQGTLRTTMADIAALGGIAKATLYNHFRTKDDVFAAVISDQIGRLREECVLAAADGLTAALTLAVERIALHPALRRVATDEPAVLAALATPGEGAAWALARSAVNATLVAAGCDASAQASLDACRDPSAVACRAFSADASLADSRAPSADGSRDFPVAAADLVLRWLASHLLDPGSASTRAAGARLLARGLTRAEMARAGMTGTSTPSA